MTKEKTQVEDSPFACPGWLGREADLPIRWKWGRWQHCLAKGLGVTLFLRGIVMYCALSQ